MTRLDNSGVFFTFCVGPCGCQCWKVTSVITPVSCVVPGASKFTDELNENY